MAASVRSFRFATAAFTLIAGVLAASPAAAQSYSTGGADWRDFAKTSAILGGSPSALQAILNKQGAVPAPAGAALRPVSFSRPLLRTLVLPTPALDDAGSGRPDFFGTVAMGLDRSRLDAKWNRVRRANVTGGASRFAQAVKAEAAAQRIERINRYVNDAVEFTDDLKQYGRGDVWAAASDTLRRGRGDCEDYAIAKLQMLRKAGFESHDLYLVIVRDLVRRQDHAVLVVRADDRFLLLDNGTNAVLDTNQVRDYRPVLTFSDDGVWTHGYRVRKSGPIAIAEAKIQADITLASATDQRSRSASFLALSTGFNR